MTTDVAVRQQSELTLSNDQLSYIAGTEFVPPGLRGNLPAILACVATGRALGLPDMVALRTIHIIDGKATYSAELMVMLVRKRGHSITGEVGDGKAVVTGKRADNGDEMTVTWTRQMAETAGLTSKQNWRKYESAMLWARGASQLCRMLFADCFAGATYTPEELGAETDGEGTPVADKSAAGSPSGYGPVTEEWSDERTTSTDFTGDPAEGTPFADPEPDPDALKPVPLATGPQKKKLDIAVAKLREAGKITTGQVWLAVATMRGVDVESLFRKLNSDPQDLHWSPLREDLRKDEASALIERLAGLEQRAA